MLSIEDTEAMIATFRAQARQLEGSADALEAAIKPLKLAQESMATWTEACREFFRHPRPSSPLASISRPNGPQHKAREY